MRYYYCNCNDELPPSKRSKSCLFDEPTMDRLARRACTLPHCIRHGAVIDGEIEADSRDEARAILDGEREPT